MNKLSFIFVIKGYQISTNNYSLFIKKTSTTIFIVAIYVDDVLVIGNDDIKI